MDAKREVNLGKIAPAFSDARGDIINVFPWGAFGIALPPLAHVAVVTSKKGSVRANHYHPVESEEHQFMYLISGSYRALSRPHGSTEAPFEQIAHAGDLMYCLPGVDHAYEFLSDSVFLNLTTTNRTPATYSDNTVALVGEERLIK